MAPRLCISITSSQIPMTFIPSASFIAFSALSTCSFEEAKTTISRVLVFSVSSTMVVFTMCSPLEPMAAMSLPGMSGLSEISHWMVKTSFALYLSCQHTSSNCIVFPNQ